MSTETGIHPPPNAPPRVIALLGPTGAGKSDAAYALATRLGAEIVVCDSRQGYRELDIATKTAGKKTR